MVKEIRAWQIPALKRQTKGKLLIVLVDVKQKLILCLWGEYEKYIRDVKVIPRELQCRLVVVDLDKKVLKKVVGKQRIIRFGS